MQKGSLLFVYGTLRLGASSDLSRNPLVEYVGNDEINGRLYNLGWFPGVKDVSALDSPFDIDQPIVYGDVFSILDDKIVVQLDAYEDYPSLYDRTETETRGGRRVWVYTYNHDVQDKNYLHDGDWMAMPVETVRNRAG